MTIDKVKKIIQTIVQDYEPEKVILFGSYARGEENKDSDLDLMIIKETYEPYNHRAHRVRSLFNPYPCAMDLFIYTQKEFERLKNFKSLIPHIASKEGIVIYDRGNSNLGS
jgi:uncharacterized protein